MNGRLFVLQLIVTGSTVIGCPVRAQDAPISKAISEGKSEIQDIIVTARRKSERLQQTPIAVTALNSASLEKLNVQQVDKIAQSVPNLIISTQTSNISAAGFSIRGIGQPDPALGLDSSVGVYLDGVYIARSAGSIFDLVEPERIEVLRGPQGTLFGRNTTGGAVQLISKGPAEQFGLSAKAGFGSLDEWLARVRVDTGNIADTGIAASLTYQHRARNGYFNNTLANASQDPGSLRSNSLMGTVRAETGDLKVEYAYDRDNRKGAPTFFQLNAASPDVQNYFSNSAALGGAPFQYTPSGRLKRGQQQPGRDDRFVSETRSQGHRLTASLDIAPSFSLKSITAYRKLRFDNVNGVSGQGDLRGLVLNPATGLVSIQPVTSYNGFNPQFQHQISEEVQAAGQVGDVSYVTGLYYFRERVGEENHQFLTFVLPGGQLGINLDPIGSYKQTATSYAGFGQASWKPGFAGQKLELTGGIRYTHDRKSVHLLDTSDGVSTVSGPSRGSVSFKNVSYLASASYAFTPNLFAYAKVSTGYASGGFDPRSGRVNAFRPERLTAYEVGLKADFLDKHVRTNLAAFTSLYKNLQITQLAAGTGGASTVVVNAGSARVSGFEAEITALPFPGLTISGSIGYTDPKYKEYLYRDPTTDSLVDIASSARFANVAKVTTNVSAEYVLSSFSFGVLRGIVSYAYRGKIYFFPNDRVAPFNSAVHSPPTNSVSARLALSEIKLGRATAEFSIFGENLLNENQVLYGIDFGSLGFGGLIYGQRRRLGFDVKVNY